ncbi:unnamed protein product [Somion occarium]|uniref:Alpha/beta hydrolase fold-3 domain-containing protein n=1 Tax=Somion occarium TaxID=3059160 RepID=A0ABP1E3R7_9APHY
MADWTEYSKPDPDLVPHLSKLPTLTFSKETLPEIRKALVEATPHLQDALKSQLPPDNTYRVKDYNVPVDGGEILVRSLVPIPQDAEGKTFPLYVWYHGGGWCIGDVNMDDYRLRSICVDLQIAVLNVEYRLAPEYPLATILNDSYAALKWAVENASLFSASLEKGFIVGGISAGAHLATLVAHWARDDAFFEGRKLTGQVLQLPGVVHPDAFPEKYKPTLSSVEQNKDAPILNKAAVLGIGDIVGAEPNDPNFSILLAPNHRDLPPAILQVAGGDPLRDGGLLYDQLLRESGVKTKLHVYPGMPHGGFNMFPGAGVYQKWESDYTGGLGWLLSGATLDAY